MALTNIELYEALKKDVSEESARMIAEAVPKAADIATKGDIARLERATKEDISRLERATREDIARLERATREDIARLGDGQKDLMVAIERLEKNLSDRILRYFVPLWVAVFAALATMIGLVVIRAA